MKFERLGCCSKRARRERLFRVIGYGTIILLLGFLWLSFSFESPKWSKALAEMVANVLCVIVVGTLTALIVLSWFQTQEETSGRTLLAIIELWPVLALCLPSLLGLGLILFSLSRAEVRIHLSDLYVVWF
ncbi:MAG: hypothetical protein WA715_09555 [Candidatus Acidiferrum sp.]|jgi:hypothetical protein